MPEILSANWVLLHRRIFASTEQKPGLDDAGGACVSRRQGFLGEPNKWLK